MDNKEKKIIIPEINFDELNSIVDKGVKKKISFIRYLKKSFKELGFKNIFHDKVELFVIVLIYIPLSILVSIINFNIENVYKITFFVSPILYLATTLFSFYNSNNKGAFELEMTSKYNLYQLSALRMFIFSLVSILINSLSIVFIFIMEKEVDVMKMIIISITGIFLFSTIFLYSLLKLKLNLSKYLVIGLWILINLFLITSGNKIYKDLLIEIPIYIHLIISTLCVALYIKNLNKLINYRKERKRI